MNRKRLKRRVLFGLGISASLWFCLQGTGVGLAQDRSQTNSEKSSLAWQSPAKLRHIVGKEKGDVRIGADGIEFRARNGSTLKWAFLDIQTVHLSPHGLTIETYRNRKRRLPGMQRFRFDLDQAMPPAVAADVAQAAALPSQNADPAPDAPAIATIPVHHRTLTGGTNGVLRFRQDGIDYVTTSPEDSRSWHWADLQTLSDPDPYHLFVFGYRDTYTFDLKAPLSREMLDWATDKIFAHGESAARPAVTRLNDSVSGAAGDRHE